MSVPFLNNWLYRKPIKFAGTTAGAQTNYPMLLSVTTAQSAPATGWSFVKQITVSSTSILTDYQVLFIIDTATLISQGSMNINGDDIRFYDSDNTTPLSYWIESGINTTSTRIWIKVPSIPNGSKYIYIQYGNPTAPSSSNGTNTFIFFDDFSGTLSNWTTDGGNWSIVNGVLQQTDQTVNTRIFVNNLSQTDIAFTYTVNIIAGYATAFGKVRSQSLTTTGYEQEVTNAGTGSRLVKNEAVILASASALSLNTNYKITLRVRTSGGNAIISSLKNDVIFIKDYTDNAPLASGTVAFRTYQTSAKFSKAFVRKYVETEPTTSLSGDISIDQSKVKSDFSDLRFTKSDGVTLLDYWIESYVSGTSAVIWVEIDSIPASPTTVTIYIYYGNPTAPSLSNGSNTFDFFDDFDGSSLDASKWITGGYGGYAGISYSVANSILTENGDNTVYKILAMNKILASNDKISIEVKFNKSADSSWHTNFIAQETTVNNNRLGLLDFPGAYPGAEMGVQLILSTTITYPKSFGNFLSNTWYISRAIKKSNTKLYIDALNSDRTLINSYENDQAVWSSVSWIWVNWQLENIQVKYDWIFAHKFSSPEPSFVSTGIEETSTVLILVLGSLYLPVQRGISFLPGIGVSLGRRRLRSERK